MPEIISLDRVLQVGIESVSGTLVPATKQLQTIRIQPDIKATGMPFVPQGGKYTSVMPLGKEWTVGKITSEPSFGEIIYLLSALFGAANITTPGGGTLSRTWTWSLNGTTGDTPKTLSVETGDSNYAENFSFGTVTGLTLNITRDKIAITGDMIGQQTNANATLTALTGTNAVQTLTITGTPTGGTFTLAFQGQTTAGIAYNATPATVAAALNLLSNVGAGTVVGSGTALPGGSVVLTFTGNLGNQVVGTLVPNSAGLTGGASPTAAIANTTPGVSITPEPIAQIIVPNQIDMFMDTTSGGLGGTKLLRDWSYDFSITGKYEPIWPLNSALASFGYVVEKAPKAEVKLSAAADAQGRTLLTSIRNSTTQYLRCQATGPIIEGSIAYSIIIDTAVKVKDVGGLKDFQGIYTRDFTADIAQDYGWGKALSIAVTCKQTAL